MLFLQKLNLASKCQNDDAALILKRKKAKYTFCIQKDFQFLTSLNSKVSKMPQYREKDPSRIHE